MPIPFSLVNRPGRPGYESEHQRHHILPLALVGRPQLRALFRRVEPLGFDFHEFAANGVLLPSTERAAFRTGRPRTPPIPTASPVMST